MTDDELAEIERVWAAASSGPWVAYRSEPYIDFIGREDMTHVVSVSTSELDISENDVEAITKAPGHVAAMLAEVNRLRALLAEVES